MLRSILKNTFSVSGEPGSSDTRRTLYGVVAVIAALLLFNFITSEGDLGNFSITVFSGLFTGMLLFLVASGLSIIFGLMDVLNLAQGMFFMVGAYVAYDFHHNADVMSSIPNDDLRFLLAIILACIVGAVLGVILERGLLRPLYDRPIFQIVLTFGVSIVMLEGVKLIWGTTPYSWTELFSVREGSFELFGQSFNTYRLFVIGMGVLLIVGIALLLRRTRIGIIIRAGVEDSEMVEALGINVRLVFTLVFTLGCAIAAFGGAIAAPFLGATQGMGNEFLLGAIAVVALGGLGSYEGTAIASVMVGLARAVVVDFSSKTLNQPVWGSLTPMLLMVVVLLVRPHGLFGKPE
jgi:branched-chain amino acid transport system permease protein